MPVNRHKNLGRGTGLRTRRRTVAAEVCESAGKVPRGWERRSGARGMRDGGPTPCATSSLGPETQGPLVASRLHRICLRSRESGAVGAGGGGDDPGRSARHAGWRANPIELAGSAGARQHLGPGHRETTHERRFRGPCTGRGGIRTPACHGPNRPHCGLIGVLWLASCLGGRPCHTLHAAEHPGAGQTLPRHPRPSRGT